MMLDVAQIAALFEARGEALYGGEAVSQLQHALQAAHWVEQHGGDDQLVIAALLHDLGHLLFDQQHTDLAEGLDDGHQHRVVPFLRGLLPDAVVDTIALHVDAKRYLCHVDDSYIAHLSEASRLSLALQGGVMNLVEAAAFEAHPMAARAIALRHADDAAKVVGAVTPPLTHYLERLQAVAHRHETIA